MDLIKLYKKRRYIIKTAVLVLIIIIAGIFYINPTKEDGSVIINKDNISDKYLVKTGDPVPEGPLPFCGLPASSHPCAESQWPSE